MSTHASARVPLPSDTPSSAVQRFLARPGKQGGLEPDSSALSWGRETGPQEEPMSLPVPHSPLPGPLHSLLPCPAFLLLLCVCLFSLLPGLSLPAVPICPHLFSLFLHLFPFSSRSVKCRADISWELWPSWGLRLLSPLDPRPRMGPPHLPLSCALRLPPSPGLLRLLGSRML